MSGMAVDEPAPPDAPEPQPPDTRRRVAAESDVRHLLRWWWVPGAAAVGIVLFFGLITLIVRGWGAVADARGLLGLLLFCLCVTYLLGGGAFIGEVVVGFVGRRRARRRARRGLQRPALFPAVLLPAPSAQLGAPDLG